MTPEARAIDVLKKKLSARDRPTLISNERVCVCDKVPMNGNILKNYDLN